MNWLRRLIKAATRTYDIAQPSRHWDVHFSTADNSDADSLISESLQKARARCRYEVRNNSYAKGIIQSFANDIIGTGPTLQLKTPNEAFNAEVERRWGDWGDACDLSGRQTLEDMLQLAIMQGCEAGEAIFTYGRNPAAQKGMPSLGLMMFEPDLIDTPWGFNNDPKVIMGVRVDDYGRPVEYYVLKDHPGKSNAGGLGMDYTTLKAEQVLHLLKVERPGQTRGMPWLTPAIPLFAFMRQYTLAVIQAAKNAANFSAVMQSDAPVGGAAAAEEFETLDIESGSMLTLPQGWQMSQLKAEQPVQTYEMFKREILSEIARCICMTSNVAAADSSRHNYASGRLDWQVYFRHICVIRNWMTKRILNPILNLWLQEAMLMDNYITTGIERIEPSMIEWYWPGIEHVDPQKEANAQQTRLSAFTTSLSAEYARQGKDWRKELEQIAIEQQYLKDKGIKTEPIPTTEKIDDEEDDKTEDRRLSRIRVS